MLCLRGDNLRIDALAGTAGRGDDGSQLLRSDKDRREHELVVETITGRLEQAGLNPWHRRQPQLARHGLLTHLHTPITADAAGRSAAVGGALRATQNLDLRDIPGRIGAEEGRLVVGHCCAIDHRGHQQARARAEPLAGPASVSLDGVAVHRGDQLLRLPDLSVAPGESVALSGLVGKKVSWLKNILVAREKNEIRSLRRRL